MPREPRTLRKILDVKADRINLQLFNFIENLLVFRVLPNLMVKPESGVQFRISREETDKGICLLIRIDHPEDPIFAEGQVRPDYLALYLYGDGCICTIIEMKGKSGEELKHGLDQIKALADKLKIEFREHLPARFQLHVQGILLSPFAAQIPGNKINQLAKQGLEILHVQYSNRAELFPYTSRRNHIGDRFKNVVRHPTSPCRFEEMLMNAALHLPIPEKLRHDGAVKNGRNGIHINYVLSGHDDYASLYTRGRDIVIAIKERDTAFQDQIRADIAAAQLDGKFIVEAVG